MYGHLCWCIMLLHAYYFYTIDVTAVTWADPMHHLLCQGIIGAPFSGILYNMGYQTSILPPADEIREWCADVSDDSLSCKLQPGIIHHSGHYSVSERSKWVISRDLKIKFPQYHHTSQPPSHRQNNVTDYITELLMIIDLCPPTIPFSEACTILEEPVALFILSSLVHKYRTTVKIDTQTEKQKRVGSVEDLQKAGWLVEETKITEASRHPGRHQYIKLSYAKYALKF